jgi:aminomethyltransferase
VTAVEAGKKTTLHDRHVSLGARLVPFAGFWMPIQYRGIIPEHMAVRTKAGLFDVSHMGEFVVEGTAAAEFLQRMTVNNVTALEVGQAQYSALCYEDGGIVDDLLIYRFEDHYLLVVNAANIEKDYQWLADHLPDQVRLRNVSDELNLVALQGPLSREILQPLTDVDLQNLPYYHFTTGSVAGQAVTVARTGYTGELGYELFATGTAIIPVWDAILERGEPLGLQPAGLGARDTLRLEMKYCLYGNDIDETTHPFEAGLGWIVKLDKGPFIGRDALVEKKQALKRRLVCLELVDRGIPRSGYAVYGENNQAIGTVTSGGHSPSLQKGIGLAYVDKPYDKVGTVVAVDIRGKRKTAQVVKPPFYKQGTTYK